MDLPLDTAYEHGFSLAGKSMFAFLFPLVVAAIGASLFFFILQKQNAPPNTIPLLVQSTKMQSLSVQDQQDEKEWLRHHLLSLAAMGVIGMGAYSWLFAGQLGFLAAKIKNEELSSFDLFIRSANDLFFPYLGCNLLIVFAMVVATSAFVGLFILMPTFMKLLLISASIAALFVLIWFAVRISLFAASLAVDQEGVMTSFERSWTWTDGRWWKILFLSGMVPLVIRVFYTVGQHYIPNTNSMITLLVKFSISVLIAFLRSAIVVTYYSALRIEE